jgi:hypothetical protein
MKGNLFGRVEGAVEVEHQRETVPTGHAEIEIDAVSN